MLLMNESPNVVWAFSPQFIVLLLNAYDLIISVLESVSISLSLSAKKYVSHYVVYTEIYVGTMQQKKHINGYS